MRRTIFRLAPLNRPNTSVQAQFSPADFSKLVAWDDPTVEVEPGQHVISVCRQYKISFPNELRSLKGLRLWENPYKLSVYTSQKHCFFQHSMKYFDKLEHPFAKSMLDIYIEKKKEPLWIHSFAHGGMPFANKTASRKVTHALRDALVAAGYDRFGQRVLADGQLSAIADLYGTLRLMISDPLAVCNAKFADLLECAKQVLSAVEIELRRDKNGHHVTRKQQNPRPTRGAWQGQRREPNDQRRQRVG
ncbi:hypothetical protein F4824DRAFT_484271 [Ustulina deusta]|nr:hypothetical protein F4823DRAFT_615349 [Ustulina deusta]KAI3328253.1 hypothetical protein F4824DRAFT_484271 [Ustulina deusta]